jgi:hypothetical protein
MTTSSEGPSGRPFHAVQFYQDDVTLCAIAAAFLGEGLERRQLAVVIATPDHIRGIEQQLSERGLDLSRLRCDGELTMLDADDVLARIVVDGAPDAAAFRYAIGEVFSRVITAHPGRAVRAYGEIVDLLWKRGEETAAIRVETLWNQLANTHEFKLLCGYSIGNFYKDAAIEEIKGEHSHLISDTGEHIPLSPEPRTTAGATPGLTP